MRYLAIFLLASIVFTVNSQTIGTMPPSVVKTVPEAGDTNVDPALQEITVTFSKNMKTKNMWSWCSQSPETFPVIDQKKIHYKKDERTCVLPVKLEPGKTYVIWINSQRFNSFRDTQNNPAVPYLLVFKTASSSDFNAAVAASKDWLALVDNDKYDECWESAADFFKSAVSRKLCEQGFRAVRNPLGKNLSRKLISKNYHTSLPNAPKGKYIVIEYKSSFENNKSVIETITPMLDKDGKWRVAGYYIK